MQQPVIKKVLISCTILFLACLTWVTPAFAFDNPELLPDTNTPIIDLADFLPQLQEEALINKLESLEAETGWKLRVLTQYDQTPGRAVRKFWGLNDKSILLVADSRGGNLLAFNVGDAVYDFLPRTFWVELQTRFGNIFYVRDNGENTSIVSALETVEGCLRQGGCNFVPGLPQEQWILTFITSLVGGLICGFAAVPSKSNPNQLVAWQWALIFSPLWGILFIAFGIGPVVTRTSEWLPLFRNILAFVIAALVAYLSPTLSGFPRSEPEK